MTYRQLLEKLQTLSSEELLEKVVVEDITGTCSLVQNFKAADKTHNYLYAGEYYLELTDHIVTKDFDV
jgi:hypothetical protein